ncbi:caspase [Folsomia candida]|uniref:Caspase-1-A n=1 Tax=Folsomia candida TaxID=158441 RepID=A0A226F573_FOLCA|nr:caspase [Folsomia candida]OXA64607.1 Caspase-1-A [Folsomia candida]
MNYPHKTEEEDRIRCGSEVDVELLTELFKKLEYEIYTNCCITDIQDNKTLEKHISGYKKNLVSSKAHSAIIIFMGHGHNHEIELTGKNPSSGGSNYANIYHDIVQPFSNKSFPKFEKKPKVFIFESCQNFAISDYSACLKMQNDIPSDILICLPALPGFSAYRNKTQGSLFMHYLVKIMMNHAHNMHMVELMGKIQKHIADEILKSKSQAVSISHWASFLFSKFYLLPQKNNDLPKLVGQDEGIEDMDET